ncbi:MAG: PAS domain S-box protein, partial [Chloroflexota bacterium]
ATDETGRVEFMNPVAEALTGWKQEEARAKPLAEVFKIINEATRQEVESPVERVLRDGVIVGLANHTLLVSRSGREYPIADSGAPIRIGENKTSGVVLVFRDQSEERSAALAVQTLANRQRDLLAAIPDIIMEVDSGKVYRWANQSGIDFFGEDVIGKEAADFFEGEQNVYQSVQPLFNGNEDVIYVESWQRREDGKKRLLAWWCRVLKDSSGAVSGALSSARDVTEQRHAEEALHISEQRYHSLFENMIEGYAYCQMIFEDNQPQDFIYIDVNPAFEILTGLKDVVGKKVTQVIPGIKQDNPELFEIYGGVVLTGKPVGFEVYLPNLKIWLLISVFKPSQGHFVTVFENITERKDAEEALKAYSERLGEMVEERTQELHLAQEKLIRQEQLAVLGQLAGGVGHELRNPLGVMANAVYFLKLTLPNADAKVKQYFGILENEIHTAEKIISDLLDFSRVKSIEREQVPLKPLITRLLERHQPPDNILVKMELPSDLPPFYGDPRQVSQVLGNLVVNAYQAMPSGGELVISATSQDEKIIIQVQDSGTGISAESISKVFEPLFTTKARGIGLGLAVSKRLIEVNGGEITVNSEMGKGSTFTVQLPTFRGGL